ncbi:MAG: TetR family transcriptional regulator [Alphaproteobacteria bacterium]|nr:TetR family transcriptional regulator [Alphaproteobacteria bacterium]
MSVERHRARTEDQKLFRRQEILSAAQSHFEDVGYESFSMANLAKLSGVAKGTLYLYFTSREEVFLALYGQILLSWSDYFVSGLHVGMDDREYCVRLHNTAMAADGFVSLLVRLEHIIEHNVSFSQMMESKRLFAKRIGYIAEATAPALGLTQAQATELVKAMGVLLIGVSGADQGPNLQDESVPEDVQSFIDSFASEKLFVTNACFIIRGIRADKGSRA